jgi:putative endonuclease
MPFWKKNEPATVAPDSSAPDAGSTPGAPLAPSSPATEPLTPQQRGQRGEDAAAQMLVRRGYKIIARNWRAGNALRGEIDCIAWTRGERGERVLAFVEVKTRRDNNQGAPQEAVTRAKQRQISRLANAYISLHRIENIACRFDVVEVWLTDSAAPRCALRRNAFEYSE